jgi:hypothetical protein
MLHTHFSAVSALSTFVAVLIVGTMWRLVAYHLIASANPRISQIGQGMAFQY